MAVEWYHQVMGGVVGPLSATVLLEHAQQGRLTREIPVRRGDGDHWVPAEKVKGLFPASPRTSNAHAALPHQVSNEGAIARPVSDRSGTAHDRRRLIHTVLLLVVGLIAVAVALLVYREQFPSDNRVATKFRSELRDASGGWESSELYRSKGKSSDFEYRALHALYREDGAAFGFGAGLNFGRPANITACISSVSPAESTTLDGSTLALFQVDSQGRIESEMYYGLAKFSKNMQVLLRRKAVELHRAATVATGY